MSSTTVCFAIFIIGFIAMTVMMIYVNKETNKNINSVNGVDLGDFGKYITGFPNSNKQEDINKCIVTNTGQNDSFIFLDVFGIPIGAIPKILVLDVKVNGHNVIITWGSSVNYIQTVFHFSGSNAGVQAVNAANKLRMHI